MRRTDFDDAIDALIEAQELEEMAELGMPAYFLGLDLGQAADYTALAILERQPRESSKEPPVFHCRHLQRWPLKTSYPKIVEDTVEIVSSDYLQNPVRAFDKQTHHGYLSDIKAARSSQEPVLAIDATGAGAPVVDLFKKAFNHGQSLRVVESYSASYSGFGDTIRPPERALPPLPKVSVALRPIQITGGDTVTVEKGLHRVPKRDLVSVAQVALQTGRLKIAAELPDAPTLTRELQNFQVKINVDTAHDSYGVWREGSHDDLVLAVSLALWIAQNDKIHRFWYA